MPRPSMFFGRRWLMLNTVQDDFIAKKNDLSETYELHRQKARLIYRKNPGKVNLLGVSRSAPRIYVKWIEAVRNFYTVAASDQGIQEDLARAKLTLDDINAGLTRIDELVLARTELRNAKGESQSSTKINCS